MSEYLRAFIPPCPAYGWEGGPGFNTRIVTKANGRERRNADWSQPQHAFGVPFQNISQADYAPIKQLHLNRRGAWGNFLFRDQLDYTANNETFAIATAGQTEFQLAKFSVIEGVEYQREVTALYNPGANGAGVQATPTITANGSPVTPTLIDYDRGKVYTAPMAGGEIMRWTGTFALWVRFASDRLPMSIDNKSGDGFVVNGSVDVIEQPPPEEEVS